MGLDPEVVDRQYVEQNKNFKGWRIWDESLLVYLLRNVFEHDGLSFRYN